MNEQNTNAATLNAYQTASAYQTATGTGATTATGTQPEEKDYKREYEKQLLEIERLKSAISKTNSENAEYKRKAEAQMSEEEKKAKELQELLDGKKQMEQELSQMRLEKELLANGFSGAETEKLIKNNFSVKDIAEIVKTRVDEAVKSARAEFTKNTTAKSPMGNGSSENAKSDFQIWQEERNRTNNIVKL